MIECNWDQGEELESLLDFERITYQDGRLLHDETSPIPQFASSSVLIEKQNEKTIKAPADIAESFGFRISGTASKNWLPMQGSWDTPDGASVSIYSAFVKNRGSVKKARDLSKMPWTDLWLPRANDDFSRMRSDFIERAKGYVAWINGFDREAGEDRWDAFASTYAPGKYKLSEQFINQFGLNGNQYSWSNKTGQCVAKSIAWGTRVTKYRDDSGNLGKAIVVSDRFLGLAMRELQCDLMIAIGVTHYPSSRSYGDQKNLDGGLIVRLTADCGMRVWKRNVQEKDD